MTLKDFNQDIQQFKLVFVYFYDSSHKNQEKKAEYGKFTILSEVYAEHGKFLQVDIDQQQSIWLQEQKSFKQLQIVPAIFGFYCNGKLFDFFVAGSKKLYNCVTDYIFKQDDIPKWNVDEKEFEHYRSSDALSSGINYGLLSMLFTKAICTPPAPWRIYGAIFTATCCGAAYFNYYNEKKRFITRKAEKQVKVINGLDYLIPLSIASFSALFGFAANLVFHKK